MAAPGGHYSHAIAANGFVFVSGQLPIAPDGRKLDTAPFEEQARQVLDNVAHALKAAGSSVDRNCGKRGAVQQRHLPERELRLGKSEVFSLCRFRC